MKKISKLGLISVLCLVLVIGGVFATWSYGTNKATGDPGAMGLSLTPVAETKRGTLAVTKMPTLEIDDADNDHVAELVITGDDLVITFTANANSQKDILENGIDLQISFSATYGQYNSIDIITFTSIDVEREDADQEGLVFTYTITKDTLKSKLTLGSGISLPTYDDYIDFKNNYLAGKTITITVTDTTPETV